MRLKLRVGTTRTLPVNFFIGGKSEATSGPALLAKNPREAICSLSESRYVRRISDAAENLSYRLKALGGVLSAAILPSVEQSCPA